MEEQHLTVADIAGRFRVSVWTVRRWIKSGQLRAVKADGPNGLLRVPESACREYIEAHTVSAEERTR